MVDNFEYNRGHAQGLVDIMEYCRVNLNTTGAMSEAVVDIFEYNTGHVQGLGGQH